MAQSKGFHWLNPVHLGGLAVLLVCGLVGGLAAQTLSLPLPFLIGGVVSTLAVAGGLKRWGTALPFPENMRRFFMGVIGTLIGGAFSPDLVALLPGLTISILALLIYVPLALGTGYLICRHIGGYDPVTAFYSAMPGGLIEAVEIGSQSGGNAQVLTWSHLSRILCVVILVPLLFWVWSGGPVGSSAGQSFEQGQVTWLDFVWVAGLTGFGIALGKVTRMPASHLLGPLLISAIVHGTGIVSISSPAWLLYTAQLVVGVGLASQFSGKSGPGLLRIASTVLVMVVAMLVIGVGIAAILAPISPLTAEALFLSFAPGGVTEMGLIALSLSISPVLVVAHHMFRILLVVIVAAVAARRLG